uniref:Potassium/proton antiporter CemA n=1 Tax=Batophora oerstedii TaxID=3140 RepID=A0A386JLZ9_BATOE|nr:envelope membrane protein [Batophora oerstedii]
MGLIPRSIIRTLFRFIQQLITVSNELVIQEFRISRYQVLVSIRCLLILTILPIFTSLLLKIILITPFVEYFWNYGQTNIFLNKNQENQAFQELKEFEEQIYFDLLLEFRKDFLLSPKTKINENSILINNENFTKKTNLIKQKLQQKIIQITFNYSKKSLDSIIAFLGDFITLGTFLILCFFLKPQIIILKSFLIESLYSLSDTTKSFLLILGTDLLVGFHSSKGWELFIESILNRFGFSNNNNLIFLFVAIFPVILDTLFKYWIFRYLNKVSPSTVITYHSMIE